MHLALQASGCAFALLLSQSYAVCPHCAGVRVCVTGVTAAEPR